jgi:2-(1,2-epoxy-1,2-dihydrophenyl)acetyl-CoA isomerase
MEYETITREGRGRRGHHHDAPSGRDERAQHPDAGRDHPCRRHRREEARVVVLTGEGRAFCSGQDLGDRANVANINLERTLRDEYIPMLMAVVDCPVPVIAAVNGTAAGAGANLALVCDVVIATASASFIQAFSRIGLIPDAGGTWALPRQVGLARAMGASLFADKISAEQAACLGHDLGSGGRMSVSRRSGAPAAHLAQGPTEAYKRVKQAFTPVPAIRSAGTASAGRPVAGPVRADAGLQGRRDGVPRKAPGVFEGR